MPIHDWPEQERPREKLIARGPTSLSDAELLALFLGSGFGGRDAVQTARDLLQAHGPLRVLLDRPARELARLPGLGPARSCTLAAGLELAHRYLAAELEHGEAVGNNPAAVGRYLQHRLRGQAREIFMALFLDNRHRLIACEELFHGTINAAPVYPREVVRRALLHNAAAVILRGYVVKSSVANSEKSLNIIHLYWRATVALLRTGVLHTGKDASLISWHPRASATGRALLSHRSQL